MGFGGGSRRRVRVSANHDFGERASCFYLGVVVPVHILAYAEDGAVEANNLQVDIGEPSGTTSDARRSARSASALARGSLLVQGRLARVGISGRTTRV